MVDSSSQRVVITGMGLVCPLGSTPAELWDALVSGRSGIQPWNLFPLGDLPIKAAAPAAQFQGKAEEFGLTDKEQIKAVRKGLKVMCRECQMGVAVAQLALADAGLSSGRTDPLRTGVAFGADFMISLPDEFNEGISKCMDANGRFDFSRWPVAGLPQMSPLWLLKYLPNMPASHVAIYNDLRGPNNSITMREAAANLAMGDAYQIIRRGVADAMLVGATGTRLHPWKTLHALQQEELAEGNGDPTEASRPFDRQRSGAVLGEGAAAVIVERLDRALARGATIYAEVLACASSAVVGRHMVADRGRAFGNVMRSLLRAAQLEPEAIGHVHAHGLSTRTCDQEEAQAIHQVLGTRSSPVPVVAAKSYFGNLGAGSGMVEMIASVLALRSGRLFATRNYRTPDPDCPVSVVTDGAHPAGASFINLSVTPQGQASGVLIGHWGG